MLLFRAPQRIRAVHVYAYGVCRVTITVAIKLVSVTVILTRAIHIRSIPNLLTLIAILHVYSLPCFTCMLTGALVVCVLFCVSVVITAILLILLLLVHGDGVSH